MFSKKLNGQSLSKAQQTQQAQQAQRAQREDDSSDGEPRITPLSLTTLFRRNTTKAKLPARQRANTSAPQPVHRSNTYHVAEVSPSKTSPSRLRANSARTPPRDTSSDANIPPQEQKQEHKHEPELETSGKTSSNLKRHGAITRPVQGKGTRGILVLPYASEPVRFSQPERLRNPGVYLHVLPSDDHPERGPVAVRLYHCESLYLSQDLLRSPGLGLVISTASAFLGECDLRGWGAIVGGRHHHNCGYAGLNATQTSGGFHIHYPDDAGLVSFDPEAECDWEQVMQVHRRYSPRGAPLLVGVGPGIADKCCVRGNA